MTSLGERILRGGRGLLGAPWAWHGTGPEGWGCVGFVCEAYARAGLRLRDPYQDCHGLDRRAGAQLLEEFERRPEGEPGGLVIFAWPHPTKQMLHLALVVDATTMLGSLPERGVAEVRWAGVPEWDDRLVGYASLASERRIRWR